MGLVRLEKPVYLTIVNRRPENYMENVFQEGLGSSKHIGLEQVVSGEWKGLKLGHNAGRVPFKARIYRKCIQ